MKNNLFLKISALILVLLLCAPMLLACNDTTWTGVPAPVSPNGGEQPTTPPATPNNRPTQPPSPDDSQNPPVVIVPEENSPKPTITERFDGEKIKFYVDGEEAARSIDLGEYENQKNEVDVLVKQRNEQVEKELGVDIVLAEVGSLIGTYDNLQPILASQIYVYDVLVLNSYFDMGLVLGDTAGCLYNLLDLPKDTKSYLNLGASYWDYRLLEEAAYQNVAFHVTGDLTTTYTGSTYVSFVNTDMWAKYAEKIATLEHSGGYSDISDIVYNGYWTMDLWMELAKLCYLDNGDKVMDYMDQAGFMTYDEQLNNFMADALLAGSNMRLVGKDTNGKPTVKINTDQNIAIYTKLYTLLCESNTVTIPWLDGTDGEAGSYILDIFAKGNVLLNVSTLVRAETYLLDMEDDFYICPLPMFDHSQFDSSKASLGYTTRLNDSELSQFSICTAIGDKKLPAVTATLELMAYYSEQWVTPTYGKTVLGKRYDDNAQMLTLINQGIYTDFAYIWSHSLGDLTWNFRQNYSKKDKIEYNLKQWNRTATGTLNNKVLPSIEEAYYD